MRLFRKGMLVSVFTFMALNLLNFPCFAQFEMDRIFPDSTQAFFSITDTKVIQEQWNKTDMGQVLNQPNFQGFRGSFQSQFESIWTSRFGMKLNDVLTLSAGEVGGGLIAYPGKKPGFAMILNITGKKNELNEFLTKMIKQVTSVKNGEAKKERLVIGSTPIDATVLTIPPDEKHPEPRTAWYIDLSELLLVTDQQYLAELLLTQLASGQGQANLASVPGYQVPIKRCISELPQGAVPQIRFFVNPLGAGEAVHSLRNLTEQQRNRPSTYNILAKQGFDGVQGVAGIADLATENFDYLVRVKVHIPNPPAKAFKMLAFQNFPEIPTPKWIGDNLDRVTVISIDTLNLFNNIGPLFDEFLETEGAWNDILIALEKDEKGPRVNMTTELVAYLGNNLSSMRTYTEPIKEDSEKFLFALDIKQGGDDQVRKVLHRMFDTDPDFRKVEFESDVIWQYVRPQRAPRETTRARSRRFRETQTQDTQSAQLIKGGVFCVSNGYLFISNDAEYLRQRIGAFAQGQIKSVSENPRYQQVQSIIRQKTADTGRFLEGFVYTQKEMELNYSMFREGRISQGGSLIAQIAKLLSTQPETGEAKQTFDGSKLPPFAELAEKVGFGGFYGRAEADGWFFERFGVKAGQQ